MADYFVYMDSAQDDSDANWNSSTLSYLDLDTCLAAVAAGSNVWVAHDHSKTYTGDIALNNNGTLAAPIMVQCVNRTTGAKINTAVEQTTGSSESLEPFKDKIRYSGVTFKSGDRMLSDSDIVVYLGDASIELATNATTDYLSFLLGDIDVLWEDITLKTNNAGEYIFLGGGSHFRWVGGGVDLAGSAPNYLIKYLADKGSSTELRDLDLSNAATIISLPPLITNGIHHIKIVGCKLPSGGSILNSNSFTLPHEVDAWSCDNGDGFYYFESTRLEGQTVQATNCYLNAKYDGTNGYSAKMTSNANAFDHERPLRFKLAELWVDSANSTLTVETITEAVTLQDDEFWIEVESPDATDKALRNIDRSSRQTVGWSGGSGAGTPSNLTTSTAAWTENLTGEVKQKVAVTLSDDAAGAITVWACLAKPSTTVYVDPKITVS